MWWRLYPRRYLQVFRLWKSSLLFTGHRTTSSQALCQVNSNIREETSFSHFSPTFSQIVSEGHAGLDHTRSPLPYLEEVLPCVCVEGLPRAAPPVLLPFVLHS